MSDNFVFNSNGVLTSYSYNNTGSFIDIGSVSVANTTYAYNVAITANSISIQNSTVTFSLSSPSGTQKDTGNYWLNANGQWAQITSAISTSDANNANFLIGKTWNIPGAIGLTTANTGSFTSLASANLSTSTNTVTIGTAAYHVSNGNFGIGNSVPTDKLSVNGSAFINTSLTVGSSIIVNSTVVNSTSIYWNGSAIINATGAALIANNTTYVNSKTEGNLNVNSAIYANNSTYAYGKTESVLNVNSAIYANNSTYAYGKAESALNVNTANNSSYLGGQPPSYYLSASSGSSTYLPLAGGTMTGQLNIGTSTKLAFGAQTRQMIDLWSTDYGIGVQGSTQYFRSSSRFSWHRGGTHSDTENAPGTGGTVAMTLDSGSHLYAYGSMRSPIFYDQNDTGYYADPNSTSQFAQVLANDWFRPQGQTGLYSQSYGQHFYPGSQGAYWNIGCGGNGYGGFVIRTAYESTIRGYLYYDSTDNFGLLHSGGGWAVRTWNTGVEMYGSSRSPIHYDSDDTGYYIDPNSTSNSALRLRGGALFGPNPSWGAYLYVGTNGNVSGTATMAATNGNIHIDTAGSGYPLYLQYYTGGYTLAYGSMRSPIFYDMDDTNYYCDPNGTTRVNDFIVKGMWAEDVLIADLSASGASTIESTTCFTSGTYRSYDIQFQVVPGTMSAGIYMQFYVGGAWRTTAGDYRTYSAIWNAGGSQGYAPNSYIDIGCGGRIRNYAGLAGYATLVYPSRTDTMPIMTGIAGAWDSTVDSGNKINFTGLLSFNSAISGFRIYASSGTISGYVKVFGKR